MRTLIRNLEVSGTRLNGAIAVAVFVVFSWLTQRHVGESVFLEDQVDQLQNFESLLRMRPEGLWGAVMSDTRPPARALGPLGAIVFGLPVAVGLGIDSIHVITSLLISLCAAAVFLVCLRLNGAFAWLWFLFFSASGIVWWNAALFWTNTLLLPAGLGLMALAAACLWRPSLVKLWLLVLTAIFAMQLHLVACVALPVVLIVGAVTAQEAHTRRPGRRATFALAFLGLAAVGPYLLAEGLTRFQNTRAVLSHVEATNGGERTEAVATAAATLAIAVDPARVSERIGVGTIPVLAIGTAVAALALLLPGARLRGHLLRPAPGDRAEWVILWLTISAVAATLGQALFFYWTTRPLAGFHYVTLLTPFYAIVPSALLSRVISWPRAPWQVVCGLGCVCVAFLLWLGPPLADRFVPQTPWSYQRITTALDTLCAGVAVDTAEGSGFAAQLNPQYDSVLRYLMNRRFSACRYQPGSDLLIVAARGNGFDQWYTVRDKRYRLEVVLPPGIARYRRWP